MKIDVSILSSIPFNQQERFREVATKIVIDSFVLTADRDYITARFAYFHDNPHLFFWSSAQALEKYLKANVMLFCSGAVKKTHEYTSLVNELREYKPSCLDIDLKIPDGWSELGISDWPSTNVDEFLQGIKKYGDPCVRYDQINLNFHLSDLVFLDRLTFNLRSDIPVESIHNNSLLSDVLGQNFFDLNYSFASSDYKHCELFGLTLFNSSASRFVRALNGGYGNEKSYKKWASAALDMKSYVKSIYGEVY